MSVKKQVGVGVSWSTCNSCGSKYHNRNLLQKHVELGCGDILPFITPEGNGIFELSRGDNQQIRISQDSSIRKQNETLFIHTAFLTEMGLKTLDWVKVTKVCSGNSNSNTSTPIFMKIWAIDAGPPFKAYIPSKTVTSYPSFITGIDVISLTRIKENLSLASEIHLEILEVPRGLTLQDIQHKLKIWLVGKIVVAETTFRLQVLTHFITTTVVYVTSVHISTGDEQSFRVDAETDVVLTFPSVAEGEFKETSSDFTLESIGGLNDEIKEISDTITYALSLRPRAPRGILLYGEHGTGKTLLMKATCNSLGLTQIWFQEHGRTRLRELFQEVIRNGKNSAILIEHLDTLSSVKRDGDFQASFTEELKHEMDTLPSDARVVVIGSAKNADQVDPILRSAKVFAKEVELPVPSANARLEILRRLLSPFVHDLTDDNIQDLADDTHGFVGADLEGLRATAFRVAGDLVPAITHFRLALNTARPSAMKSIQLEIPHVRWDDIGGLSELKFQLKQSVVWPLKHPEAFERLGLTPPKGILMYGPPGCSKTMIAKALATETSLNFISVKGSDLLSKWVGESEKAVQNLFRKARKVAPAILFFDELDALGSERGGKGGGSNVHERVLAQLLVEIDGIESLNDVTILAATNRPDLIDKALTRPGRLDRIIYVPLPDSETRREILRIKLSKMPVADDVSIDFLVEETEGHSGAEIGGICQEAGLKALEKDLSATVVTREHFVEAIAKSPPRIAPSLLSFYESYAKLTKS